MASDKKIARGYGARYGPKTRSKYSQIEEQQRDTYKCPYCHYEKVNRESVGIWHCSKCDATFTNKAFKVDELEPIKKNITATTDETSDELNDEVDKEEY